MFQNVYVYSLYLNYPKLFSNLFHRNYLNACIIFYLIWHQLLTNLFTIFTKPKHLFSVRKNKSRGKKQLNDKYMFVHKCLNCKIFIHSYAYSDFSNVHKIASVVINTLVMSGFLNTNLISKYPWLRPSYRIYTHVQVFRNRNKKENIFMKEKGTRGC